MRVPCEGISNPRLAERGIAPEGVAELYRSSLIKRDVNRRFCRAPETDRNLPEFMEGDASHRTGSRQEFV